MTLYHCECDKPKAFYAKPEPCPVCQGHLQKADRMNKLLEAQMLRYAKMYSNMGNFTKTGIAILDSKPSLPRDCLNPGGWFGFVIGFKMCYFILTNAKDVENDATRETTSNIESVHSFQIVEKKT